MQLIVLGFNHHFHGEIIDELERLRESDTVRVIDSRPSTDANGELEVEHLSDLSEQEAIEMGTKIGALIGLGVEGEEGMEAGAIAGGEEARARASTCSAARRSGMSLKTSNDPQRRSSCWSITGRRRCGMIARAGGFRLGDGFISPFDLIEIGLMQPRKPNALHDMETAAPRSDDGSPSPQPGGMTCSDHAE